MLLKEGLVTAEQLQAATSVQKRDNNAPLGQILVQRGVLSERQLIDVLCRQTGYPRFDQDAQKVDAGLVKLLPQEVAAKFACAPLILTVNLLSVGLLDPENDKAVDNLAQITGKTIKAMIIGRDSIQNVWMRLYGKPDLLRGDGASARMKPPAGP